MPLTGSNRNKILTRFESPAAGIEQAAAYHRAGDYPAAFDCIQAVLSRFPGQQTAILAAAYDLYRAVPVKTRYHLYVSRFFDFNLKPDDQVLDIGSGHLPFPFATHLADFAVKEDGYGRAGVPFKHIDGKPVFHCSVEDMPFEDGTFDFAYCSHVLEHVRDPEAACRELARVARRGYIETPSRGKDIFLSSAGISNHLWCVENCNGVLVFTEYSHREKQGLASNILMDMHVSPVSQREKAFSALIYLQADQVNTMVAWEKDIPIEVRRRKLYPVGAELPEEEAKKPPLPGGLAQAAKSEKHLKLLQVHTFYPAYLDQFYRSRPGLAARPFDEQMQALQHDGFSAIHLLAPHLDADPRFAYTASLVVANCRQAQARWLAENGIKPDSHTTTTDVLRWQIEAFAPDVIYFTDPVTFDDRFVRALKKRPALILGWRAADIPGDTSWAEFDCILSSLQGIRETAKAIGARHALHFTPGFPAGIAEQVARIQPAVDVVFVGQYTRGQHTSRNNYLRSIAEAARTPGDAFSAEFFLSGEPHLAPESMRPFLRPPVYGLAMHQVLRRGRIAFDARGDIGHVRPGMNDRTDLARSETANMRIYEATGSGVFLLTEHFDSLARDFAIGTEIETFRDNKELLDKIRYYLAHPQQREDIARAGQKRCLQDHGMAKRLEDFDSLVRGLLENNEEEPAAANLTDNGSDTVAAGIEQAASLIDQGNFEAAHKILSQAKAMQVPHPNLDYLRAKAFNGLGQTASCKEALKEELRYFPNNEEARKLYTEIQGHGNSQPAALPGDEFEQLHAAIAPYTMLGIERLKQLYRMAVRICQKNLPGNFVECGVAAGGSSALLAWVIKKYSRTPRLLYAFDSFEGMPPPTGEDTHNGQSAEATGWGTGTCAAPVESLREICTTLGVQDIVKPVKGYFQQTLPARRKDIGDIAFLHMDGDWYASTKAILEHLYDPVVDAGYVQIDDYGHWDGCQKAVAEFFRKRNISATLQKIDYTGVWLEKAQASPAPKDSGLLNLGCGDHFHPEWTNVDFQSNHPDVITHDLRKGIPFADASFNAVYHSHLLEHFPKDQAAAFMKECCRILKPGGILRVAVPDLEMIVRCYLDALTGSLDGSLEAQHQYDWILLELFDQMVRNVSGGDMLAYWKNIPETAEDFVIGRMGPELIALIDKYKATAGSTVKTKNKRDCEEDARDIARFRLSGEIHQWMYDRYSLARLLKEAGLHDIEVCPADQSSIPAFNTYHLDILKNGYVRKPDSLFMEGRKP